MGGAYALSDIFVVSSVFFDSLLDRFNQQRNFNYIIRFCLHSVFNGIISLVVGIVVSLVGLSIMSVFYRVEDLFNGVTILMLPLFLFVCFTGVILLNYSNVSFSFPKILYNLYASIIYMQPRRSIIHAFIFFLFIFLILGSIVMAVMVYVAISKESNISDQVIIKLAIYSYSISFIITSFLYSYGTANELIKVYRQFILWISILGGVILFSAYQVSVNLEDLLVPNFIVIASIVFGFILTIPTVADKGFTLVKLVHQNFSDTINDQWDEYYSRFSFDIWHRTIRDKIKYILLTYIIFRICWRLAKRYCIKVTIISLILSALLLYFISNINLLIKSINFVWNELASLISGDEELVKNLIIIGVCLSGFIYTIAIFIRRFSINNWQKRYNSLGAAIFLFTLLIIFSSKYIVFIKPSFIIFIQIILLIWIFIGFIVERVFKIYRWIKN